MKSLALFTCASLALAGMSGTYTIKSDGSGDFLSIYEAGNTLSDSGLSGDCVFELYGDTLEAAAILDAVAGSDTWTTTFRPGPGEHTVVADGMFLVGSTHNLKLESLDLFAFGAALSGCRGFRLSGCRLSEVHTGISLDGCAFDTIAGNSFTADVDGAHDVIYAEGGHDIVIANNFLSGAVDGSGQGEGLVTINWVQAAGVFFNTFRCGPHQAASGTALLFDDLSETHAIVSNNLIILAPPADTLNACTGFYATTPESLRADYNCYYIESLGNVGLTDGGGPGPLFLEWAEWQALGLDPNGLNVDPRIVGPLDLHLRQGSPCIGAGVPVPGFTTDIDGDPRDPAHPCIGADEYRSGALAETGRPLPAHQGLPTIVRGVLFLPASGEGRKANGELLDISGRKVLELHPGACCGSSSYDLSRLAPGVFFLRGIGTGAARRL
ncbi:hypothetical protein FJY71_07005, partial [candidate division WOR-3 bacterium]|nr:hypothetical protein [candidate division WOR-3 bacterium]